MSNAEALGLMISFGSLIATIIFGILIAAKKDNKKSSGKARALLVPT